MAGGRPTSYHSDFCKVAEEMLSAGKSIVQVSSKIGVHRDTIYAWAEAFPEFSDTLRIGRQDSQAHWEDKLEDMMFNREVNAPLAKLYFANRFGWHDKQEVKQEVKQTKELSDFYGDT
tara:strand:- start:4769 stop:5122 length:354 start_codon:yes stop_codon:yes gene_type:complete